jgi:hypothetical protein
LPFLPAAAGSWFLYQYLASIGTILIPDAEGGQGPLLVGVVRRHVVHPEHGRSVQGRLHQLGPPLARDTPNAGLVLLRRLREAGCRQKELTDYRLTFDVIFRF